MQAAKQFLSIQLPLPMDLHQEPKDCVVSTLVSFPLLQCPSLHVFLPCPGFPQA